MIKKIQTVGETTGGREIMKTIMWQDRPGGRKYYLNNDCIRKMTRHERIEFALTKHLVGLGNCIVHLVKGRKERKIFVRGY